MRGIYEFLFMDPLEKTWDCSVIIDTRKLGAWETVYSGSSTARDLQELFEDKEFQAQYDPEFIEARRWTPKRYLLVKRELAK